MRRRRSTVAALAVAAMLSSVAVAAPSGAAAGSDSTLVSGVIVQDGVPQAGVLVAVDLWPVDDVIGQKVKKHRAATVKTDSDGSFTVALDPARVPSGYRDIGGNINYDVRSHNQKGNRGVIWSGAATTTEAAAATGAKLRTADKAHKWMSTRVDQGETTTVAKVTLDTAAAAEPTAAEAQSESAATSADAIGSTVDSSAGEESAVVDAGVSYADADAEQAAATLYSCVATPMTTSLGYETYARVYAVSKAKGGIDQNYGNSHTLGVGVSASGSYGTFNQSGTSTRTSSFGYWTGHTIANANVKNKWRYKWYFEQCLGGSRWIIRPDQIMDGPYYSYSGAATFCASRLTGYAGHTYKRSTGKNGSFSTGMSISGVGLYAQSGWTVDQVHSYYFTSKGTICGSNSDGISVSARMRTA